MQREIHFVSGEEKRKIRTEKLTWSIMQDVSSSGLMNGKPPPADVKPQLKRLKKKTENKQIEKAKQNQAQIDDSERNSAKKHRETIRNVRGEEK